MRMLVLGDSTPPSFREVLSFLDDWICASIRLGHAQDVERLWDVLTALRGPDDENSRQKEEVTVHIRRAAFPAFAAMWDKREVIGEPDELAGHRVKALFVTDSRPNFPEDNKGSHYEVHAYMAARALRLLKGGAEVDTLAP